MLRKLFFALMILSMSIPTLSATVSFAVESTTNKAQDDFGDAKTNTKKFARGVKRKVRKATGNDNVLKDAKDKANDTGDDISNDVDKMKRK